jgi:hypothetical protein
VFYNYFTTLRAKYAAPDHSPGPVFFIAAHRRPVTLLGWPGERGGAADVRLLFHRQPLVVDLSGADARVRDVEMQAHLSRFLKDNKLELDGKQAVGTHRSALVSDIGRLVARAQRIQVQGVGAKTAPDFVKRAAGSIVCCRFPSQPNPSSPPTLDPFFGEIQHILSVKVVKRNSACSHPAHRSTATITAITPAASASGTGTSSSAPNSASSNSAPPPRDHRGAAASMPCICEHRHLKLAYVRWNKYHKRLCKEPKDELFDDWDFHINESSFYSDKDGGRLIALSRIEEQVMLVPVKHKGAMCIVRLATHA